MTSSIQPRTFWFIVLVAAALLMITMGARQSQGLFVSPINTATGLGIANVSFAMAIGQFVWSAVQPIAGAVADRYGPGRVLAAGTIILAIGYAVTPLMGSRLGLVLSVGILTAAGSGAGSFSVLIGAAAQRLPADQRGMAAGVINAGGSFGQFLFAPLLQKIITALGWMGAMWSLAAISLFALPMAWLLRKQPHFHKLNTSTDASAEPTNAAAVRVASSKNPLKTAVYEALQDRSYLLLHAGFFTCGFHIAFLVTHLPGEVQLCGLPPNVAGWSLAIIGLANIVGSLMAGWGIGHYRTKTILFWMYASRAIIIGVYLLAPKTAATFYIFAAALGVTWLSTVPPTAGLVGKLFGTRYLSTLFGLTLLSHQIGGFFGAWLGGIAVTQQGNYTWMWVADMVLALAAALSNLPIREAAMVKRGSTLKAA